MNLNAKRHFFTGLGMICVAIGMLAIFIPLLPTTPFLILAAFCFNKGSEKFHAWLLNHNIFGPPIADWHRNRVIRTQHKLMATLMMAGSVAFVAFRPWIPLEGKIAVTALIALVMGFIWTRNSRP